MPTRHLTPVRRTDARSSIRLNPSRLAHLLRQQITRQEFVPGDKFLSVREIASEYGVSLGTAHQGVKLLADQQYIETRPRSGLVVGPAVGKLLETPARIGAIQMIIGRSSISAEMLMRVATCNGVLESWPDASVQVSILPDQDPLDFLDRLVGKGQQRPDLLGVILCCCPREVKQYFAASGIPTVVNGHVEENIELSYVDRDQRALGHITASHLLERGHCRIGLLMYDQWRPGDSLLVSGIQRAMGERQLAADDLTISSVPGDTDMVHQAAEGMLAGPDRVTALITRADAMAIECLVVARRLHLRVPDDVAIISAGEGGPMLSEADPPITGSAGAATEIGRLLGQTLASVRRGESVGRLHFECPARVIQRKTT